MNQKTDGQTKQLQTKSMFGPMKVETPNALFMSNSSWRILFYFYGTQPGVSWSGNFPISMAYHKNEVRNRQENKFIILDIEFIRFPVRHVPPTWNFPPSHTIALKFKALIDEVVCFYFMIWPGFNQTTTHCLCFC